jgi:signal transduction histidine kinase
LPASGNKHEITAIPLRIALVIGLMFDAGEPRRRAIRRFENVELIEALSRQKEIAEAARAQAEAANRSKTQFFAAANHDLRQPLHALGLMAAALSERSRDPGVTGLVSGINASVEALEELFNELLDMSKLDAGAVRPELRDFPVTACSIASARARAGGGGEGRLRAMRTRAWNLRSDPCCRAHPPQPDF